MVRPSIFFSLPIFRVQELSHSDNLTVYQLFHSFVAFLAEHVVFLVLTMYSRQYYANKHAFDVMRISHLPYLLSFFSSLFCTQHILDFLERPASLDVLLADEFQPNGVPDFDFRKQLVGCLRLPNRPQLAVFIFDDD